jgi:hypothetical protein
MPRKKQTSKTIQPAEEPIVTVPITPITEEVPPIQEAKVVDKQKRAPNDWVRHCQQIHLESKDIPYKEVLKTARATYKPTKNEK